MNFCGTGARFARWARDEVVRVRPAIRAGRRELKRYTRCIIQIIVLIYGVKLLVASLREVGGAKSEDFRFSYTSICQAVVKALK